MGVGPGWKKSFFPLCLGIARYLLSLNNDIVDRLEFCLNPKFSKALNDPPAYLMIALSDALEHRFRSNDTIRNFCIMVDSPSASSSPHNVHPFARFLIDFLREGLSTMMQK